MADAFGFDEESAKRIVRSVRKTEGTFGETKLLRRQRNHSSGVAGSIRGVLVDNLECQGTAILAAEPDGAPITVHEGFGTANYGDYVWASWFARERKYIVVGEACEPCTGGVTGGCSDHTCVYEGVGGSWALRTPCPGNCSCPPSSVIPQAPLFDGDLWYLTCGGTL